MINIDLSSKFILITGALSGVAEAMVTRLLEGGAHLFLTDIVDDAGASEKLKKWSESSTQFTYQQMDVTDPQSCRTAIAEAFRIYPQLNIVLGHAGGCALHPFATTSQHEWDRLIKFNLLGQSYVARPVLEQWVERKDVEHDPQVQHLQAFTEIEHPKAGKIKVTNIPFRMSATPGSIRRPAPLIGQHGAEILSELGYAPAEIERLQQSSTITIEKAKEV